MRGASDMLGAEGRPAANRARNEEGCLVLTSFASLLFVVVVVTVALLLVAFRRCLVESLEDDNRAIRSILVGTVVCCDSLEVVESSDSHGPKKDRAVGVFLLVLGTGRALNLCCFIRSNTISYVLLGGGCRVLLLA